MLFQAAPGVAMVRTLALGASTLLATLLVGTLAYASQIPAETGFRCYESNIGLGANLPIRRSDDGATVDNMFIVPQDNSVAAWVYENEEHHFFVQLKSDATRKVVHDDLVSVGAVISARLVATVRPMVINEYPLTRRQVVRLESRHALTPCFREWRTWL